MDHNFTQQIKDWLDTPSQERDFEKGALYLLKLSGNQIMYRNIIANPKGKADFIEYQLQKYYNFRVQDLTHEQVAEMEQQVESIVAEHIPLAAEADTKQKGKREDHELLPDEIKAKFVENLDLLRRMRELHLKLRTMSTEEAPCPDSERYPFLKELIALDKKLHANWEEYDHYIIPSSQAESSNATQEEIRSIRPSEQRTSDEGGCAEKRTSVKSPAKKISKNPKSEKI